MINPKSVIRISHCHTTLRNPNDRFGFNDLIGFLYAGAYIGTVGKPHLHVHLHGVDSVL